jgi:hypothetical protein
MIIAVHQPQYLPWLGYFDKIARCDLFVFLDNVQYKKREFQNRNRIKTPNGASWLTVPVRTKGASQQKICDVQTDNSTDWQHKHWQSIERNYRKAPHFSDYGAEIRTLYHQTTEKLNILNQTCVRALIELLDISTPIVLESELGVESTRTERIIDICQEVGGTTYLSGAGGKDYLEENQFAEAGIELRYQEYVHPVYPQLYGDFVPYLSVIDLIFNCGAESLNVLSS